MIYDELCKPPTMKDSMKIDKDIVKCLQENSFEIHSGIESKKRFSAIKARKRGDSKGKFRFFIPPSHEDFVGLLYNFMGKGKEGDAHRDFFEETLVRPLNRAYRELNTAKQSIANVVLSLINPGDEVIVPDITWVSTANAVRLVGAIPIFADVNINTWTLDPISTEKLITKKTKAIMLINVLGISSDLFKIKRIANSIR